MFEPDRRQFLQLVPNALQGLLGTVIAVPAIKFLLAPLTTSPDSASFVRVLPVDAVPPSGPVLGVVAAERTDAFLRFPRAPIGAVWLRRDAIDSTNSEACVRCLQTICPHLGCAIQSKTGGGFNCPCHVSEFDAQGHRVSGPSPRDMDELECRISEPDAEGRRWVEIRYQEFQTGTPQKRARA